MSLVHATYSVHLIVLRILVEGHKRKKNLLGCAAVWQAPLPSACFLLVS
jgi:hypothetical protein